MKNATKGSTVGGMHLAWAPNRRDSVLRPLSRSFRPKVEKDFSEEKQTLSSAAKS
jgi:hypothetical protein